MAYKKKPTLAEQAEAEQAAEAKLDFSNWKFEDGINNDSPEEIKQRWHEQYERELAEWVKQNKLGRMVPTSLGTAIQKQK